MDETGKLSQGSEPNFKQIANGMPGLELRLPVLFDAMVSKGRLGLCKFVELTSTAPARLYGLADRKGSIAIGLDADIVLWDPAKTTTIEQGPRHDLAGYTPFAGFTLEGWPRTVIRRGEVIAQDGELKAVAGSGAWLPRQGGTCAAPSGRLAAEVDSQCNFGATILM